LHLFYTPDLAGDLYTLNEEESRHCLKVLRLAKGDIIYLTDGKGGLFEAGIIEDKGRHCIVQVGSRESGIGSRDYRLHIAIAPTKNIDRFEWFLEKATEIGIDEITPLICDHSERRHLRTDRLVKVITSAMKQSLKAYHPVLNEPVEFHKFIGRQSEDEMKFIAFITEGASPLTGIYQKSRNALILIGPEGDFSPLEVDAAVNSGFQVISLGNSRLRTETAGVAACHTVFLSNWT
jgi:16S rRNA (uracil1498-N3)-methyltransferase